MFMMNIRNVLIGLIASAAVAGIVVSCGGGSGYDGPAAAAPTYTVSGNITGNTVPVTLKLNGGNDLPMAAPGTFAFTTGFTTNSPYNVQVVDANDRCTVSPNGAGLMGATNITTVAVTCGAQAAQKVVRSAILNGAQQNPAVVTNGRGVGGVIVDPTTKAITGGITFSGLSGPPTTGGHHIHQTLPGDPTGNGNVIIGLTLANDGATAVVPVGTVLTDPQYAALLAGELYFNVHTDAHSGGEIRGQIHLQGGVISGVADMDGTQESPAVTTTATGKGTVIVDRATGKILIAYVTHTVTNADAAHIHNSGGSPTGPVIVPFNTLTPNFDTLGNNLTYPDRDSQMSPTNITDFLLNYLYFNVHSKANGHPTGEIRGNITTLQ
jgi:hypothetical protein